MHISIKPVSKKDWNVFLNTHQPHTFLQSWNWGEFNKSIGYKIFRLGIYENNKLNGVSLAIKINARRGSFLFVPHGPIQEAIGDAHELIHLFKFLRSLAIHEKCDFLRISPINLLEGGTEEILKDFGFRRAPTHMHSELNWILNIAKPENELLKDMRKTTRYSIGKAEKDGVEILKSDKTSDVKLFNLIYKSTVSRQHFTPFSLKYLESEFKAFAKDKKAMLFLAKYEGEIISAAMIIFENGGAFYHHGASTLKYSKVPASYLLQWEVIKEAKRRRCNSYNFWGISPENHPNHPWAGLTLFKKGFGGYAEEYIPAMDLKLKNRYWLTYMIEKVRKIKRGL